VYKFIYLPIYLLANSDTNEQKNTEQKLTTERRY